MGTSQTARLKGIETFILMHLKKMNKMTFFYNYIITTWVHIDKRRKERK
ncbi:MAG: hypothetical protein RL237_213 [Actinomycetota bacterium]